MNPSNETLAPLTPIALIHNEKPVGLLPIHHKRAVEQGSRPKRRRLLPLIPDQLDNADGKPFAQFPVMARLPIRPQPVEFEGTSTDFVPSVKANCGDVEFADDFGLSSCADSVLLPTMEGLDDDDDKDDNARSGPLPAHGVAFLRPKPTRFPF